MRSLRLLACLTGAVLALRAAEEKIAPEPVPLPDGLYAEITTPRGVLTCELFFRKTPLTVANFAGLAEGTLGPAPRKPFFDGLKFHRVVPDFVVQGGDPLGTGDGGPGYEFPDEFVPGLRHDAAGTLSMANDGPDTNGSQFFLTLRDTNRLNYLHTVFGHVVRGLEVLPQIKQGDVMSVKILRRGADALAFGADEAGFAALKAKAKAYTAAREPGPAAFFDDPDKLLPTDPPRAKNFNFKLGNFERATGVKIYARLFAKTDPADATTQPGQIAKRYAQQLGTMEGGLVALYFADRDLWALWIGNAQVPGFTAGGQSLMAGKEDFLAAAKAQAAIYAAEAQKTAGPDKPLTSAQQIKYSVDAVLDGLIMKAEPK